VRRGLFTADGDVFSFLSSLVCLPTNLLKDRRPGVVSVEWGLPSLTRSKVHPAGYSGPVLDSSSRILFLPQRSSDNGL